MLATTTTMIIPGDAYYGWDYLGDGIIERLLPGSGVGTIEYDNAYSADVPSLV